MSQQPPRPPTSGTPASSLPSVQSILNPPPGQETSRGEGAPAQGRGQRRLSRPPPPGALPAHPHQPHQQLPPIRPEPPSSSSPVSQFSPRERYGQASTSYAPYSQGPPRPGESGGPLPSRGLPGIGSYMPEHGDPGQQQQQQHQQQQQQQYMSPPGLSGNFQYMTIESSSGPVSIPVDVHAASRQADEKRKRNAGASARFRQRRKERETQSTREIDELRQQIQDLSDDADFYRAERDYLLPLVYNLPDRERHLPRPPSPRRRRDSRPSEAGRSAGSPQYSATGAGGYARPSPAYEERGDRSSTERYTRRRLTTQEYGPGSSGLGGPPAAGYGYGQPGPPGQQYAPREELPRVAYDTRLPPPPGPLPPPGQQQQPRERSFQEPPDPYRRDWTQPPPPPQPPDRRSGR